MISTFSACKSRICLERFPYNDRHRPRLKCRTELTAPLLYSHWFLANILVVMLKIDCFVSLFIFKEEEKRCNNALLWI
jgi:hypothetical protein